MNELIVHIGWAEFIGIVSSIFGSLIIVTWSIGNRFLGIEARIAVIETDIEWLKQSVRKIEETLKELVKRR